jgi:hypothetical protein
MLNSGIGGGFPMEMVSSPHPNITTAAAIAVARLYRNMKISFL